MQILNAIKGILKLFIKMSIEEFYYMDKKLIKISSGLISFIIAGALWFFVFRHINPFF